VLLTVFGQVTIEKAAQYVKGGFSFRAKKELGYNGEIWQIGFSEDRVLSADQFAATVKYIHVNPVRKGYCQAPEDYPHSSASGKFPMTEIPESLKG
jgi:putative transposase